MPTLQIDLISEGGSLASFLLQSHRTTIREKELTQLTTTFIFFQSRDGEGGEKRGLVVDREDGRAVLHLRQKGKRRGKTLANILRGREREGGRGRGGGDFSTYVEYLAYSSQK